MVLKMSIPIGTSVPDGPRDHQCTEVLPFLHSLSTQLVLYHLGEAEFALNSGIGDAAEKWPLSHNGSLTT